MNLNQPATGQTIPPAPTYDPGFDLDTIIDIHSAADAHSLRRRLIDLLGCGALPTAQPEIAGDIISVSGWYFVQG